MREEEISQVRVTLAARSYDISIGYEIMSSCLTQLRAFAGTERVYIISDGTVYNLYGPRLEKLLLAAGYESLHFVVPPGEDSKSWEQAGQILDDMLLKNLERKTPVLALGGGVVGDLTGLVAALYRRGTPLIQIPTTLLAQVDSSVGGKVAVNHPRGKNMFGTFYQPAAVWTDLATLDTLSTEEWCAGLAEVAKYAIIKDGEFFQFLEEHAQAIVGKDHRHIPTVIERCCQIKAEIVSQDERDEGVRNFLNFGHTFGHALESATMYKQYRHGEAVSIGMIAALELATLLNLSTEVDRDRVAGLLQEFNLPTHFPAHLVDDVLENLNYDKKVSGNKVTFVLPVALGQVVMKNGISAEILRKTLQNIAK